MDNKPPKPPDRSRRAVVIATVGIVVIMGLALFIGVWVVPVWQTRIVIRRYYGKVMNVHYYALGEYEREVIKELGGPHRAVRRLEACSHLPRWGIGEGRWVVTRILRYCGEPAIPLLIKALHDDDTRMRMNAVYALGEIGELAKEAIPALRAVAEANSDESLRQAAAAALKNIRGEESEPEPEADPGGE